MDQKILDKAKVYILSFLESYDHKAETGFTDLFEAIRKINQQPEQYFPFYKKKLGEDLFVVVFIANSLTCFYLIKNKISEPIKIVDKSKDEYYKSDDWVHFFDEHEKRRRILKEIKLAEEDIIDEISYGGIDYFQRDLEGIKRDAVRAAVDKCGSTRNGIGAWLLFDYAEKEFENRKIVGEIKLQYEAINVMEYSREKGMEFQGFIYNYLDKHGCNPRNIRTSTDEIDIFITISNFPVLIECRYKKDPIEAKEIRDFYGKLSNRPPITIGVFIAPNGFTAGALEEIKSKLSSRLIITIDKKLLDTIIQQKGSEIEMMNNLSNDLVDFIQKQIFEISGQKVQL